MNIPDLSQMSIDKLWSIHEAVADVLAAKMQAEKKLLERLKLLRKSAATLPSTSALRRRYRELLQKFRNPDMASETWSGRGKRPHWIDELLRRETKLED